MADQDPNVLLAEAIKEQKERIEALEDSLDWVDLLAFLRKAGKAGVVVLSAALAGLSDEKLAKYGSKLADALNKQLD